MPDGYALKQSTYRNDLCKYARAQVKEGPRREHNFLLINVDTGSQEEPRQSLNESRAMGILKTLTCNLSQLERLQNCAKSILSPILALTYTHMHTHMHANTNSIGFQLLPREHLDSLAARVGALLVRDKSLRTRRRRRADYADPRQDQTMALTRARDVQHIFLLETAKFLCPRWCPFPASLPDCHGQHGSINPVETGTLSERERARAHAHVCVTRGSTKMRTCTPPPPLACTYM